MDIPDFEIITISQFLAGMADYPNLCWIYRGQADVSWQLVPKAGRKEYFLRETHKPERKGLPPRDICRFNEWRKLAVAYSKTLPSNDFECLAFAQHYGLATRFLDWSTNPLVALFFAVDSCTSSTGAVYCYSPYGHIDADSAKLGEFPSVGQYSPPPFDSRILLQCGVFTYHPKPRDPLGVGPVSEDLGELRPKHGMNLVCFRVVAELKPILKRRLDEIGVNRRSLFPDLDGLSEYVNWGTRRAATLARQSMGQNRITSE